MGSFSGVPSKVDLGSSNLSSGHPPSVWVWRPKPRVSKTEVSKPEPAFGRTPLGPVPEPRFRDRAQKAVRPIVGLGSKRGGLGTPPFGHLGAPLGPVLGTLAQTSVSGFPGLGMPETSLFPVWTVPRPTRPGTVQTCPNRPKAHFLRFPGGPP